MLLLLEIWLAVKAFKKGWRWRVLWPFGAVLVAAVLIVAGGGAVNEVKPVHLLADAGLIVALAVMARRAPHASAAQSSAGPTPQPVPGRVPEHPLDQHAA